jgi:hypothetical protein
MKRTLLALVFLLQSAALSGGPQTPVPGVAQGLDIQALKALAPDPGVYVAMPSATPALVRLAGSVSDGVKTSTGLGGLMRMKSMLKLVLKDGRAAVRLSEQPVFYFIGKAPVLYQLVHLSAKNKTREMNLGEIRTIFDSISSDFPDRIDLSVTQVEEEIYQATVASPLAPGEYAIVEKIIVSVVGSQDRKAAGPFVLGLGLDGKPKSSR